MDNSEAYRRKQVLNCAYVLPSKGIPLDAFVAFIPTDCQQTACRLWHAGVLQVADRLLSANPLIRANWRAPQFHDISWFFSGVIATLIENTPKQTTHSEMLILLRAYYESESKKFTLSAYFLAVAKFLRSIEGRTKLTAHEKESVERLYDELPMNFYIDFSAQPDHTAEYHEKEGKHLVDLLIETIGKVYVPDSVLEYIYDIMGDYLMQISPASSLKWYLQLLDLLYDSDADKTKIDLTQFKIGRCESMLANRTGGSK